MQLKQWRASLLGGVSFSLVAIPWLSEAFNMSFPARLFGPQLGGKS